MNIIRSGKTSGESQAAPNLEGEIRDFVRKDVQRERKQVAEIAGDVSTEKLTFLIDRVANSSLKEIDRLIAELKAVRDYLQAEGERVQREIATYAHVSQTAMASVRIIMEGMGQWKESTQSPAPPSAAVVPVRSESQK
jgi:hypothetical protein